MALSDHDREYLATNQSAAMITAGGDGRPKVARVAVALVDGRLWSSGTADRARTKRLRRDPRCTLSVFDSAWGWLTLETTVRLLDGPDAGKDDDEETFLELMVDEGRLVYEFDVERTYGVH